ncbi:nucleotidyl transferase AbiEii/AbiGii toxin family protein, partial [Nocardioides sp.]|uniref:nucleotidyl transferase AbiEii/AbiGii toxin family protein n=1 Tax=Nocardioides sp. TaxID=35761 RepID=UPI00286E2A89
MLAHDLVVRPTQDLDLFTPVASEVDPLVVALTEALRGQGARVEVDRRGPGFARLTVETVDGRQVVVEIAHDARLRDSVQLDFGRVLHPDEVAADKTLALFGRAAARDLVDVAALTERYPLKQLCALAEEKDAGFDPRVLADAMNAATEHPDDSFAELGLSQEATNRLRSKAQEWRAALLTTNTSS